jgi:hypothetical protein
MYRRRPEWGARAQHRDQREYRQHSIFHIAVLPRLEEYCNAKIVKRVFYISINLKGDYVTVPLCSGAHNERRASALMPLEILHGAFVLFGRRARFESAEIAPFAGPGVHFCGNKAGIRLTAVCGSWDTPRPACAPGQPKRRLPVPRHGEFSRKRIRTRRRARSTKVHVPIDIQQRDDGSR